MMSISLTIKEIELGLHDKSIDRNELFISAKEKYGICLNNFGNCSDNFGKVADSDDILRLIYEKYITEEEANDRVSIFYAYPILDIAARMGDIKMVKILFSLKVYISKNSFSEACKHGHLDLVKLMIKEDACKCKYKLLDGLCEAVCEHQYEVVKYLIDNGDNGDKILDEMYYLCSRRPPKMTIERETTKYELLNACLFRGALLGDIKMVQLALDNGAEDNGAEYINKALGVSCQYGHLEVAKLLIKNKRANVNLGLKWSGYSGNLELVKFMIDNGANDFNGSINTIGYNLCDKHIDIVKLLINHGANSFMEILQRLCNNNNPLSKTIIDLLKNKLNKDELKYLCSFGTKYTNFETK